ncbi:MAG: hypothetical protein DRH24_19190 [Deltaproteobacteria bacterium]|nr:MAG: hypothetical protein DRH24_19190 [Deltaproteobacteria bacterium]
MALFKKLDPNVTKRESNVKFPAVILIYLMRIVPRPISFAVDFGNLTFQPLRFSCFSFRS